jgi:hypothetical protein
VGRDQRFTDATKLGGVKFGEIDGNGRLPYPSGVVRNHCRPNPDGHGAEISARKRPLSGGTSCTPEVAATGVTRHRRFTLPRPRTCRTLPRMLMPDRRGLTGRRR